MTDQAPLPISPPSPARPRSTRPSTCPSSSGPGAGRGLPLALGCGGLTLALVLAGCGGDGGSPPAPPPAPTTPAPPPAPEPPPPPEPPAAPTALRVTAFGTDFIEWSWNAVMGAESYEVQFSTDRTFTDADEVIERTAEQISYRKESLPPATSGFLRVRAFVAADPERVPGIWSETSDGTTDPLVREHGQGISTTSDGRILLELGPDDLTYGNRFDLTGRTVIFTPDGAGGYRRAVNSLEYEGTVGDQVDHGDRVALERFSFPFGGETWDSFQVSQSAGSWRSENRTRSRARSGAPRWPSSLESSIAPRSVRSTSPCSPEKLGSHGCRTGLSSPGPPGRTSSMGLRESPRPTRDSRPFLSPTEASRFSYRDVQFEDGVVGLFPYESGRKAGVLVELPSSRNSALPGYLDLFETTVYATHSDAVVVEFETRGPLPAPDPKRTVSYRLWFDFDRPFWREDDDVDLIWFFDLRPDGQLTFSHGRVLSSNGENNTVTVLAPISEWAGRTASVRAEAVEFYDGSWAGPEFSESHDHGVSGGDSRQSVTGRNRGCARAPGDVQLCRRSRCEGVHVSHH